MHAKENGWYIGIRSPVPKSEMSTEDLDRRKQIEERLSRIGESKDIHPDNAHWLWFDFYNVYEPYRNWDLMIPELHRELQQNGGKITDYFVNKFVEIEEFARPILDDIKGSPG